MLLFKLKKFFVVIVILIDIAGYYCNYYGYKEKKLLITVWKKTITIKKKPNTIKKNFYPDF